MSTTPSAPIRAYLDTPLPVSTDVSATLFISAPEDYDGGELVVEDTYGQHSMKLPPCGLCHYRDSVTDALRFCTRMRNPPSG